MGIYKVRKTYYIDIYAEGRRVRRAVSGSRKEAERVLALLKADALRGELRIKCEPKIRFGEFARKYLEYARTNKRSWQRDEMSLRALGSRFNELLFSKITPFIIEDYKRQRLEQVKPATINRELALLKFMFNLARKWKLAESNPMKEVKLLSEQKIEIKVLNEDEAGRLIDNAADYLKPVLIIALSTGMRRGEILNLRWSDIDFKNLFLYIKQTKSGAHRKIPMSSLVVETLNRMKKESEFVFWNPRMKKRILDVRESFKTAMRRAGISDLRFHDLRHTAATWMVSGGVDLVTVKEILGHRSIEMTMRYAHPTPENKRRAVEVLAGNLSEGRKRPVTIWSQEARPEKLTSSFEKN